MSIPREIIWLHLGFGSAVALVHLWLWISFFFGSVLALAQLWLQLRFGFGPDLTFIQFWLWLTYVFCCGSAIEKLKNLFVSSSSNGNTRAAHRPPLAQLRTSLQLTRWGSFWSIMAKPHKIEQHLKKESLLKFNVKLKPKLSQSQSISKAKADPNPKLIQIKT